MTTTKIDIYACLYCGAEVSDLSVPDLHDDAAWRALAGAHQESCEWVATRAHRLDSHGRDDE